MATGRIRKSNIDPGYSGNSAGIRVQTSTASADANQLGRILTNVDGTQRNIDQRRLIAAGATLTLTAKDSGALILLDTAAGSIVTLPALTSTPSGMMFEFVVTVTATSNSHIIKVANTTDEMRGFVIQDASEATAPNIWWAADNDDTITLNRTTTGLAAQGEFFRVYDALANHWMVQGYSQANGSEATPFSATV